MGLHPYANVMLATQPRRVTRRDAGVHGNLADGSPSAVVEYFNAHAGVTDAYLPADGERQACASSTSGCSLPPLLSLDSHYDEEDPLSLGFFLG